LPPSHWFHPTHNPHFTFMFHYYYYYCHFRPRLPYVSKTLQIFGFLSQAWIKIMISVSIHFSANDITLFFIAK
jgi:hypothetical protein